MKKIVALCTFLLLFVTAGIAAAGVRVDIYGPGQNVFRLTLATPLTGPSRAAGNLGRELNSLVSQNLAILPFLQLLDERNVLGGTLLPGYEPPNLDIKRFQLAGSDLLVTAFWPAGDSSKGRVQMRAFETNTGSRILGKEYSGVDKGNLSAVADRFCADLLQALTGSGEFFRSTLAFVKKTGTMQSDLWTVRPTGRDLRQITNIKGAALSPAWSQDGRFIVFTHMDMRSHALGVWDAGSNSVKRIRFPGNTVIGPAFMPNNKVAVSLSFGRNPDIYLLNHSFQKERVLESSPYINVSPTFDASGSKMAFTSNRMGGPQIFMKNLGSGEISRVSRSGSYNAEANISLDGTLVTFSRLTDSGFRIFVQDLVTGAERQVSFGPGSDEQPAFCADSYFIAFTSTRGGGQGVYLTTRHGGEARKVPTGSGNASFPRWGRPGSVSGTDLR